MDNAKFYEVTGWKENELLTIGIFSTKQKASEAANNARDEYENIRLWDYPISQTN